MGLFNNPNKKMEKWVKKMEKAGYSSTAYKSRKCCENCIYFTSVGFCNYGKGKTYPSGFCNNWWGK